MKKLTKERAEETKFYFSITGDYSLADFRKYMKHIEQLSIEQWNHQNNQENKS